MRGKRIQSAVVVMVLALAGCSKDNRSVERDGAPMAEAGNPGSEEAGAADGDAAADRCGPCEGGALCLKGQRTCACRPYDHTECREANGASEIWWIDSCGAPIERLAACPVACQDGVCLAAQLGQACDPNDFQQRCEQGRPVTCAAGTVVGGPACAADERCVVECPKKYGSDGWSSDACRTLLDERAACEPDGPACDPETFTRRCDGDLLHFCDLARAAALTEDCAATGMACVVEEGSANCVVPGACSGVQDDTCVDEKTVERCQNGVLVSAACVDLWPEHPTCYAFAGGKQGSCGPADAEPCEPASFTAHCENDKTPVNCHGWIETGSCNPIDVCAIGQEGGAKVAVCTTVGSKPCDPATYQGWCKGNVAVNCIAGLTYETNCYSHTCQSAGGTADCVAPEP